MKALCAYNCCIPSSLDKIYSVVNGTIDYLQQNYEKLDECTAFEVRVILNEMISNAIRHGNKGDEKKCVKLSAGTTSDGYAYFIIEDEGQGFNSNEKQFCCTGIADPEELGGLMESGRGILIVTNLCEKVKFNKRGNKVVLLKKIIGK